MINRFSDTVNELFSAVPRELVELFALCTHPYEAVGKLREYLYEMKHGGAYSEIERDVWVAEGATIADSAIIMPPAVISSGAEIRHCAYIRGSVYIGRGAVVGNSTEVKNAILMDGAQAPHYNYVGDSVLGSRAHMGAGAVTSNLKSTGGTVVIHGEEEIDTGMRKMGALIGDGAEIGCGCVLNPGAVIGRESIVYPLTSVRGTVAPYSVMKDKDTVIKRRDRG